MMCKSGLKKIAENKKGTKDNFKKEEEEKDKREMLLMSASQGKSAWGSVRERRGGGTHGMTEKPFQASQGARHGGMGRNRR